MEGLDQKAREVDQYETYEDYLDKQIKPPSMLYLQDRQLARQLVEQGYRGTGEALKREEFETLKREIDEMRKNAMCKKQQVLAHEGIDVDEYPLLKTLAEREKNVRNGKLTTIVFIRDKNAKGQEISGYIDYGHRLEQDDFKIYFERKRRLLPRPSDLSFYNWTTQMSTSNPSKNFQVIPDLTSDSPGLLFKNKRDRKILIVDPTSNSCGDNSKRVEVETHEYLQVVIYDHTTRRKS
mmetsp:Transcript_32021/g.56220  ORF Transcript_32021/g.56220 Transcript_32021/m.56220 type:complete len:237 (-) Transcript_32021:293-1003(-)|eukprot:CAMPEP_0197528730 /NCGR_PEP_ID=MMETSP1318-20131121/26085_1 /TAXON_ID=552666 /ORGANISM="Partenskyella glossopodia, Strain RCC365" /LENGTH=236 /DNA_ID=CAMNT_0043083935 /DNA_START=129 /DNA_END=839 /DNA_ORIENTATION=+